MNCLVQQTRNLTSAPAKNLAGLRKVTHVIFDMDGLLLDTEKLYTEVTQKILDGYNKTYTWEIKIKCMGLQHQEMCETVVHIYNLPITWQEYSNLMRKYAIEIMENTDLMPDTEPIYEGITRNIASSYGKDYPHEVRMRIMGTTEQLSAKIACKDLKLPITVEQYLARYYQLCRENFCDAKLLKGASRLLHHLHSKNVPFCLATSSGQEMVDIKCKNHKELFKLFNHKVCGSTDPDVKNGKPSPDIFLVAAQRFIDKPLPENCLVFEDAPNGVTAARAANMQVVMVPDKHIPKDMCSHATVIIESLEKFKPEEFGLPPFDKN